MCLSRLIDKAELNSIERRNLRNSVGYKVFIFYKDRLYSEYKGQWNYRPRYYSAPYSINRWIKNTYKQTLYTGLTVSETYTSGFHIFLLRKDAKEWANKGLDEYNLVIRKVKFKDVTSIGFQQCNNKLHIAVTQKMLICPKQ